MRGLALAPAAAYARAVVAHRARKPQPAPEAHVIGYREPALRALGYRLYLVAGATLTWRDIGVSAGEHMVLGRHTCCDMLLDGDSVSLRHVLVRATLLDDGAPVLSVLDLDSASGFELSDGTSHRAVVATGPLVFRIGSAWIVALPRREEPSDVLGAPCVRISDEGSHYVDPRDDGRLFAESGWRVTSIPGTKTLHSAEPFEPFARYEITMSYGGQRAGACFSTKPLEHGILVGRDDRCSDVVLRGMARKNPTISRIHALIIRERDAIRLYDLASTNGTSDGVLRRVRSMPLAERKGERRVALFNGTPPLTLEWRVLA